MKTSQQTFIEYEAYDSKMHGYFHTGFIDFMFKGKSIIDSTNLFLPNNFKNNDKFIIYYFRN